MYKAITEAGSIKNLKVEVNILIKGTDKFKYLRFPSSKKGNYRRRNKSQARSDEKIR